MPCLVRRATFEPAEEKGRFILVPSETPDSTSAVISILGSKCPHCRRGAIFKNAPLNYLRFTQMHDHCPACGQSFNPEPGFYQIAMYASYGFTVAILLVCFAGVYIIGHNPDAWVYTTITISVSLLLAPLNYRYSRILMLYLFGGIDYNPTANHKPIA